MPPITDIELWAAAERDCFNYLLDASGGTENQDAFIGEMPESCWNGWMFEISSGDTPLDDDFNMDTPGACGLWGMYALVTGKWIERSDAQRMGTIIRAALPTAEQFTENVHRFRPRSEPRLLRGVIGETPIWILEYELKVILGRES